MPPTCVVESKPDLTPVTDADRAAEELVRPQLKRTRPRDAVQGEEFETTGHGPRRWVIDPIDGTKNFVRGVPVWATLISLVDDGQPVLGLVAAPALNRRWWAARRLRCLVRAQPVGAKRMHVSAVAAVADASLSYSSLSGWRKVGRHDEFLGLADGCWRTRAYGDFWSYMLVAEGAVDIAAEPELERARHGRAGADRHRGRRPVHLAGRHARPVGRQRASRPTASCTTRCWPGSARDRSIRRPRTTDSVQTPGSAPRGRWAIMGAWTRPRPHGSTHWSSIVSDTSLPQRREAAHPAARSEVAGAARAPHGRRRAGVASSVPVYVADADGGVIVDVDGNSLHRPRLRHRRDQRRQRRPRAWSAPSPSRPRALHPHLLHGHPVRGATSPSAEQLEPAHPRRPREAHGAVQLRRRGRRERRQGRPPGHRPDAVVAFDHAYHGRTNLTMALTAKAMPYKTGFGPFAPEVYRVPDALPVPRGDRA